MAARELSRSAFSTKPKLEGGTAGLVGGSVTPCGHGGQAGRRAARERASRRRRPCGSLARACAPWGCRAKRAMWCRSLHGRCWPCCWSRPPALRCCHAGRGLPGHRNAAATATDLRRLDGGAHRQRPAGGGPPRRRGAAAATGEAGAGRGVGDKLAQGRGGANGRPRSAGHDRPCSSLPPAAAAEGGAALQLQGGAQGGGHGCGLRRGVVREGGCQEPGQEQRTRVGPMTIGAGRDWQ